MKFATPSPYADPEAAMKKLLEYANAFEPIQDSRITGPCLFEAKGSPAEYTAGLQLAIERGYLKLHESGTFREVHTSRRGVVSVIVPQKAVAACPLWLGTHFEPRA